MDSLRAPVQIVRDRWGVPHIKAENQDDLFFAQGFVQAQDRLFQIDLWRRSVQGRLAEVLGGNFVERDVMTRRVQYKGDIEADWSSYGPDTKAIASAFVNGINTWIRLALDQLPEEFLLAGWAPEPWSPEDLLNRTDAFVASGDARDEVFRARLITAVGVERAGALLDQVLVPVAGVQLQAILPIVGDILGRAGTPPFFLGLARPLSADRHAGSNAWAIARSDRGAPLVAGDPHRPLENPSLRYLVHLQAPGWNVIGATAPWLPGVAVGHNDRVAWSMTAARADVQDVYVEKLNPTNPRQFEQRGRWVDFRLENDAVAVKGRQEPFEYERLSTPHGVIIALDRERNLAYGVRWSGNEPGTAAELAALGLNRAKSAMEFREALGRWRLPAAEFVYADIDGRIGRQLAALIPVRAGWNGALPVPGHVASYEWTGWQRAPSTAPTASASFVASANDSRARRNRIADALQDPRIRNVEGFKSLQHDVLAWNAGRLVPLLAAVRADSGASELARQQLLRWDLRITSGALQARLYIRWEDALLEALAARRIPPQLTDGYIARAREQLVPALTAPSRTWFDGNVVRQRDALLVEALDKAAGPDLKAFEAENRSVSFLHPLAVTQLARQRFNVGPFTVPGYGETVFAIVSAASGLNIGPSFRAILDAGDWDRSVATQAPGQSASPQSPHFRDLAALWAAGDYFPLSFSESAIQRDAEATLTLVPRGTVGDGAPR